MASGSLNLGGMPYPPSQRPPAQGRDDHAQFIADHGNPRANTLLAAPSMQDPAHAGLPPGYPPFGTFSSSSAHAGPSRQGSQNHHGTPPWSGGGFYPPLLPDLAHSSPPIDFNNVPNHGSTAEYKFDLFEWYPKFLVCHQYFLDRGQHEHGIQALAEFLNIQLPWHKQPYPVNSAAVATPCEYANRPRVEPGYPVHVSLIPYIRRLVATGYDDEKILRGFFGQEWKLGIGHMHEMERRNYMFACRSANFVDTKASYDVSPEETVPFLAQLKNVSPSELSHNIAAWEVWMTMRKEVTPQRPDARPANDPGVKDEPMDEY